MAEALVTGGAGFIGYHLAKFLADEGLDVTICDDLSFGTMNGDLEKLCKLRNVHLIRCDLSKKKELNKLKTYDCVYHLAAINGTMYFYKIPHKVLRINILTTINMLEWFAESNCKKIVFASSPETYAGSYRSFHVPIPTLESVPLTIDDIYNSRWSYAGSKILGELLFVNYAREYKFRMSIIRYHNVYGPRMGYTHAVPEFAVRILKQEDPFRIYGARPTRAFCYVDDAVHQTELIMESTKTDGKVINVGNDKEEIFIYNLAKKMFNIADFHPKIKFFPPPEGSVERRCPDMSLMRKLTGYEPKIDLDSGLKWTFDWYKSQFERQKLTKLGTP